MSNKFLKAKHWQLFIIVFGLPLLLQFIIIANLFLNFNSETGADSVLQFARYLPVVMLIFTSLLFAWFWSVGIGLQKIIPVQYQLKTTAFKVFLIIPLVYIFTILSTFFTSVATIQLSDGFFFMILPFHLLSMLCIFYCIYFVAKTFKTAELQRKVSFSDFAGEFFMVWFYPIGIWIIQPKINRMLKD
jgi:hypothetical protein